MIANGNRQPVTPVDQGNPILAETPGLFTTTLADSPAGQRLALTVRTPSATVTVFLKAADAKEWARQLNAVAGMMSDSGLIVS